MNDAYWKNIHDEVEDDLAAVNYPALPLSFNRLVDEIFSTAMMRVLSRLERGRAFEIGCGRGRWIKRLRGLGWRAHGMDIAGAARPGVIASADALPLRPASVDLIYAITVLQHLPGDQGEILRAAARVIKPGGHLLLVEVLARPNVAWQAHMYPKSAAFWRAAIMRAGLEIVEEAPIEHLPLVRLIEWTKSRVRSQTPGTGSGSMSAFPASAPSRKGAAKTVIWNALTLFSRLLEPGWRVAFPTTASHRLFLARRA